MADVERRCNCDYSGDPPAVPHRPWCAAHLSMEDFEADMAAAEAKGDGPLPEEWYEP